MKTIHHRVALRFLARGTPLRRQVDDFVAGCSRDTMPVLKEAVAPFALISIVERRIEARRAEMHRAIALRTASGPYASLALRLGEIRRVATDPTGRGQLESAIAAVRNPKKATRVFNLQGRPDCGHLPPPPTRGQRCSSAGW